MCSRHLRRASRTLLECCKYSSLFEINQDESCVSPSPLASSSPSSCLQVLGLQAPSPSQPRSLYSSESRWLLRKISWQLASSHHSFPVHKPFPSLSIICHSVAQAPRWHVTLIFYLSPHPSPGHCWSIGSTPKCPSLPKPLPPFILTPRLASWFIRVSCFLFSLPVWSWTGVGAKLHTCSTAEQHPNLCPFPESHDASIQQLEWDYKQFPCLCCQSLSFMLTVTRKFVSGFWRPKTDFLSELLCRVLWSFLTSWEWQFYFNCRAFALAVTIFSRTMT